MDYEMIDRLVAEKIMDYEYLECGYFSTDSETTRQKELEEWMERNELFSVGEFYIDVDNDFWVSVDDFEPSIKIQDAWKVLDKYFHVDIEKENDNYFVCIHTGTTDPECEYGSELTYFAEADTAPLAICLAGLKAVGVDVDE